MTIWSKIFPEKYQFYAIHCQPDIPKIRKILTQTNGSNTKTVPVLCILEEKNVFQMCLGVPALI